MSQLTSKFEAETGNKAMYRMNSSDYHALCYVNWLEALVEKFNSSAQSGPTNNGSTSPAEIAAKMESVYKNFDNYSKTELYCLIMGWSLQLRACR